MALRGETCGVGEGIASDHTGSKLDVHSHIDII